MNITIYGAGKTGQYLTRVLTIGGHDLTVIENDTAVCEKLSSLYDISVINSEGIRRDVFNKELFASCELFIAVGPVDEMNIMACSVAKKVGARKTIARVRNEDYGMMDDVVGLEQLGVDLAIHPEKELSREITNLVILPNAIDVYELYDGRILIVSIIAKENSDITGKSLQEISSIFDLSVLRAVVVEKGLDVRIPRGSYVIEPGDKIYAIAKKEDVDNIFKMAGYEPEEKNKDIMVSGSGTIARTIAQVLEDSGKFNLKIIVGDEHRATQFSELFPDSLVVYGEATEVDLLAAEGIIDMDFFLALTENDETNMVASLLANHLQVKKTITLIEKTDYLPITKTIGLRRCINSAIATSNAIMRFVKHGNILSASTLKGIDIEVITLRIPESNRYLDKPLHNIKFPPNTIIGVIVRSGSTFVPSGHSIIKPGDEIVFFADKSSVDKVEQMFEK
jgi:trk system potassium uptake protein